MSEWPSLPPVPPRALPRSVAQNDLLRPSVARAPIIQPFAQGDSTGLRLRCARKRHLVLKRARYQMMLVSLSMCFNPPCEDRVPASSSSPSLVSTGHIFLACLALWRAGLGPPPPLCARSPAWPGSFVWMLAVGNGPFEGPSQNNPLRLRLPHSLLLPRRSL